MNRINNLLKFFCRRNLNIKAKRIISCLLVVTVIVSTITVTSVLSAAESEIPNYPLFSHFNNGSNNPWKFGMKDFGVKPAFTESTAGYNAPTAVWNANDSKADISWNAYSGATGYTLNIYEGSTLFHTVTIDGTKWSSGVNGVIQGGDTYDIQVLALDSSNKVIAASAIRTFEAKEVLGNVITTINDFSAENAIEDYEIKKLKTPILSNETLVVESSSKNNYAYFRLNGDIRCNNAQAVTFFVKADGMAASYKLTFGTGTTFDEDESGVSGDVYIVSATNPNSYIKTTTSGIVTSVNDKSFGDFIGGYYVVIPLSVYADSVRQKINDGDYSRFCLYFNNIYYKDGTGEYVKSNFRDNYQIIFDDFAFISDTDLFIEDLQQEYNRVYDPAKYQEILDAKDTLTSTVYKEEEAKLLYADKLDNNNLTNDKANTGYSFLEATESSRKIVFNAISETSTDFGAHLRFVAPESGLYDLSGALTVVDNSSVTDATVNYRILKVATDNTESVVWPNDGSEWVSGDITAANLEPVLDFPAAQLKLKKDEALAIEAYVHSNDKTAANVKLSFGNATTTLVEETETYKGKTVTYPFGNYALSALIRSGEPNWKDMLQTSRWEAITLHNNNGAITYTAINAYTNNNQQGFFNLGGSKRVGYKYVAKTTTSAMRLDLGYGNYGVAFKFRSPSSGNATVSLPLAGYSGGTVKYRVTKNGTTIYPTDSSWASLPASDSNVAVDCSVATNDVIAVEFYSTSTVKDEYSLTNPPSVTISNGTNANALSDTTFSPLWERPYNTQDYTGKLLIPAGAVWSFGLYNTADKSVEAVDYYDSSKKLLYKDGASEAGYVFDSKQLKFNTNDSYGLSLGFTAPTRGNYDLSTALDVLQGKGTLYARVMLGDKTVWPESGDWYSVANANGTFSALELGADAGEQIILQVYGVSAEDSTEPMVIGLGTPIIQRLSNRVFTETGNTTIYNPADYTAFEDGYSGEYIQLDSRFIYSIGGTEVSGTNASSKKIYVDDNNYFAFVNDLVAAKLSAGNTAKIEFTSPMVGSGTVGLASTVVGDAEYKLSLGNRVLFDWTASLPQTTDISTKKGDKLILEIRTVNGAEVKFDSFNISLLGKHNNANSATDDGFYAIHANPYGDEYYVGKYQKTDASFWNFNFYNAKDNKIVNSDYYNSDNKSLTCFKVDNLGYYFGANNLTADINVAEKYGLALGFTAPRSDTFNSQMGLRLTTSGATANIAVRMIKIAAADGKSKQIWPAENSWYEQEISTNGDIKIPYAEHKLEKGDTVYIEIYAVEGSADKLTINLVSPAFLKENSTRIETMDIVANLYRAVDFSPGGRVGNYNSVYIPMDNRWNFKFAEVSNGGSTFNLFEADRLNSGKNQDVIFYSPNGNKYRYIFFKDSIRVVSCLTSEKNYGVSYEYIVPTDGKMSITAPTSISALDIENASLKYSIVLVNAIDGTETKVWPKDSEGDWEILNKDKMASDCMDVEIDANIGDKLIFKTFWDVDATDLSEYLANNSTTKWLPEYSVSPIVTMAEYINKERTNFSAISQFIGTYLVSPFWRVEYALDSDNPEWNSATAFYSNIYWKASGMDLGISSKGRYWIKNKNGSLDGLQPSLAWKFSPRFDGHITLSNKVAKIVDLSKNENNGDHNVQIRITLNGQNIYPEKGWIELKYGDQAEFKDIDFEVVVGDEVRFEMRTVEPMPSGDEVYLQWSPTFMMNKYKNIYSSTDDIYNMLDEATFAMFKAMSGNSEFDQNLAANKILSEKIKDEMENLNKADSDDNAPTQSILPNGTTDDYEEWTEEIVTPGGGWRKVIRRYVTEWWVYALIIAACVIGVAAVVVVLIILRKKGKIGKRSKNKIISGG